MIVDQENRALTMLDVGEKGFISSLKPLLKESGKFVNGFGHDVSVIDLGFEDLVAFKIDRASRPVLLDLGINDYSIWGRLAAVANISDMAAGGAVPHAVMLSLVLPRSFCAEDARNIVLGCQSACDEHGVSFVGGDTKEGRCVEVIGAAVGRVARDRYWSRKKANVGDVLYVTGKLGGAGASMMLMKEFDGLRREECIRVLSMPTVDLAIANELRACGLVFSACDLSDGLADAVELFCSDNVGIVLEAASFPLHDLAKLVGVMKDRDPWRLAFAVGDWGLAVVVKAEDVEGFEKKFSGFEGCTRVGTFVRGSSRSVALDSASSPLPVMRNEHFRSRLEDGASFLNGVFAGS